MSVDRVRSLVALITESGTAAQAELAGPTETTPAQFIGLTEDQIREVAGGQPLPATYRCFLELIGGGASTFLRDTDVFHPQLLELSGWARELLAENEVDFDWRPTDRVISMHQGYEFDMLRGTADDPEVWHYNEVNTPEPVRSHARFTDWLAEQVQRQTAAPEPRPRRTPKRRKPHSDD